MLTRERPPGAQAGGPDIDPRIRQRRVEVALAAAHRRFVVVLAAAVAVTLVAAGFWVLHSPWLGVRRLVVAGAPGVPAAAAAPAAPAGESRSPAPGALLMGGPAAPAVLAAAARIHRNEPLVDVDPSAAARRLEALPWVDRAQVRRSWPHTVRIALTVRAPVGQIPVGGGAKGPVATVDATGRVLTVAAHPLAGLPVLQGLGAPPPAGSWIGGSPGAGAPLGAPASLQAPVPAAGQPDAGGVGAVLEVAAALHAAGPAARTVQLAPGGQIAVVLASGTVVDLGPGTALGDQLVSLRLLAANGALSGAGSVDLTVPDRPAIAARSAATGPSR